MPNRSATASQFYPALQAYLERASSEFEQISRERQVELRQVAEYVQNRLENSQPAKLTFICTHNSRRSHLSQLWAQISADYYGLNGVETYSGGTEATGFNPRAVEAMRRSGLAISTDDASIANPVYQVRTSAVTTPYLCFSKVYNQDPNPKSNYCAIMTCSDADSACPIVMGCDLRVPIRYEDPKVADNTSEESARYDERCQQISREMLYMMSLVRHATVA